MTTRAFRVRSAALIALTAMAALCCAAQEPAEAPPSAQTQAPPQTPTQASSQPAGQQASNAQLDEGLKYLRSNQFEKALASFQKALDADPENATANLLAASAALNLFQGDGAVTYAENARRLAPNDWRVDTTLVTAYAVDGKLKERDAVRAKLVALHNSPDAPDAMKANGFLLDLFKVKNYRVEAVQYFKPIGKFHTYYRFLVRSEEGKRLWEYELQSDDFAQKSWAEAHPQEAAAGGRQYTLESDSGDTHVEYRLFSGDPGYDEVRAVVARLLMDRTKPFPAESPKGAVAVQ
jgi:tetratricopeptide (TPR) repeat protein